MEKKEIFRYFSDPKFNFQLKRSSPFSAGFDLQAAENISLLPKISTKIYCGIKVIIPVGYYGRIADKSSICLKNIHVTGGVIDSDYRGNVYAVLINNNEEPFQIKRSDKIAQLIIEKIWSNDAESISLDDFDSEKTIRDTHGFGEMTKKTEKKSLHD